MTGATPVMASMLTKAALMTRRRFRVSRVGLDAGGPQRRSEAGNPSKRIADTCELLYRDPRLVALRRGPETYETAALPLSYVGASASIGDDFKQQLFARSTSNGVDARIGRHNA